MKIKFLITFLLLLFLAPTRAQDTVQADTAGQVYFIGEADTLTIAEGSADKPIYTKRTFTPHFKEEYGRDFNYTVQPMGKSFMARIMEWIGRIISGNILQDDNGKPTTAGIIWYIIAVLVVLGLIYFIVWMILGKKGGWIFGRGKKKIRVFDADTEDIHEMDFATLIKRTRMEGNYRLAVRYYYLWLLKKLSVKEVIDWHKDKTNSDYYYEITDPALRSDFKYLSYVYDHSWYGEFPIDHLAYAKAEKAFLNTLEKL